MTRTPTRLEIKPPSVTRSVYWEIRDDKGHLHRRCPSAATAQHVLEGLCALYDIDEDAPPPPSTDPVDQAMMLNVAQLRDVLATGTLDEHLEVLLTRETDAEAPRKSAIAVIERRIATLAAG